MKVSQKLRVLCLQKQGYCPNPLPYGFHEEIFNAKSNAHSNQVTGSSLGIRQAGILNRGLLRENLRIEVPVSARRFADNERQTSEISTRSCRLQEKFQSHSAYATPVGKLSDVVDLGTPSAPPFINIGREGHNPEIGSVSDEVNVEAIMCKESPTQDYLKFEECQREEKGTTVKTDVHSDHWQEKSMD